jgi:hypothetical protein
VNGKTGTTWRFLEYTIDDVDGDYYIFHDGEGEQCWIRVAAFWGER